MDIPIMCFMCYSATMKEVFITLLAIVWNILTVIPKIVLAVWPLYQQLSSFKQDLIATAFGVSPFLIWLIVKLTLLIKRFLKVR